jgi:hypothetical protein
VTYTNGLSNLLLSNNPAWPLNLAYTRPALDVLVLNSLREAASPGYLDRQARTAARERGQSYWVPRTLEDVGR